MSYFNNDHLQINNIIIDFEENIGKISSICQIINSIDNIEEFIELKNQLNNLLTDIENDTSTLINTLKIIQYNIRKLYDDFSLMQNNYEDIEEKLKMIINDNTLLIHKNKELNEQIISNNQKLNEKEKNIQKLIVIIKNNENLINEASNKKESKNNTANIGKDRYRAILKGNESSIENKSKNNINHSNYNMRKNNSVTYNISNIIKDTNTFENDSKKNNEFVNINNNSKSSTIEKNADNNSISTGKYIFKEDFDQGEEEINSDNTNKKKDNITNIKNRIEKVEKIISIIYKNNNVFLMLKKKYGDDLETKIINENVSPEFLDQILKDIIEFSELLKNETNKSNKLLVKKEKNKKNEININNGKEGDKYRKNKDFKLNYFQNDDNGSKLTNYFLFNLQREKMIDSQQRKEYKRPKTPKI